MNPDHATIINFLKQSLGSSLISVYQAGITDQSPLSDIDLIIVTNTNVAVPSLPFDNIDIRFCVTKEAFLTKSVYFPFITITHLYGEKLPTDDDTIDQHRNIIKLSCMHLTSFLRNFYQLKNSDVRRQLIALNDFAYANAWAPDFKPEGYEAFWQEIVAARNAYPSVKAITVKRLMDQAINYAWLLIDYLNTILIDRLPSVGANTYWGKQPTLVIEANVATCRILTERHPIALRARIIYLPQGFNAVTNPIDVFTRGYLLQNFTTRWSIKYCIQLLILSYFTIIYQLDPLPTLSSSRKSPTTVKKYFINSFFFQYDFFKRELSGLYSFTFTPSINHTLPARQYIIRNYRELRKLYRAHRMEQYDIVQHNRFEGLLAHRFISGQKTIFEVHGFDIGVMGRNYLKDIHSTWKRVIGSIADTLIGPLIKKRIRRVDLFYVSTPDLIDPIARWSGRTPLWLPNPIDTSDFNPDGPATSLIGSPVCFLAARLHGDKKPEIAFNIFEQQILPRYPDAVLHLIDTGELKEHYHKKHDGNPHYVWHGYMDKKTIASVIRGSDLIFGDFAIGALSLLPMQVMFCKRPIITLDNYEIIKTPVSDLPALTLKILDDAAFRDEYIARNYQYVANYHTAPAIAQIHLENLNQLEK